jgi:hypothetical protein
VKARVLVSLWSFAVRVSAPECVIAWLEERADAACSLSLWKAHLGGDES